MSEKHVDRLARRMGAVFVPFDKSGPEIKPMTPEQTAARKEIHWSCRDCRWRSPDPRPEYPDAGHCRRYPPQIALWTVTGHDQPSQPGFEQQWPWMQAYDWCGEWEENNRISHPKLEMPR